MVLLSDLFKLFRLSNRWNEKQSIKHLIFQEYPKEKLTKPHQHVEDTINGLVKGSRLLTTAAKIRSSMFLFIQLISKSYWYCQDLIKTLLKVVVPSLSRLYIILDTRFRHWILSVLRIIWALDGGWIVGFLYSILYNSLYQPSYTR